MPTVFFPVEVAKSDNNSITEFFGNVVGRDPKISAAHVRITAPGSEAWQTPEFDEWALVVEGEVRLLHAAGTTTVPAGSGVHLKAGFRVKWIFPGPCEITEFFGNVASKDSRLSACMATVTAECAEAYQAPEFAEYVLVLSGEVHMHHEAGTTVARAPSSVYLAAGERVKWQWPGPCTYVPICLPAFSPHNCHREAEAGAVKDEEAMDRLRALHTDTSTVKGP